LSEEQQQVRDEMNRHRQRMEEFVRRISALEMLNAATVPEGAARVPEKKQVTPTRRRSWQQVRAELEKKSKGERDAD
jgi:hypothetical protein